MSFVPVLPALTHPQASHLATQLAELCLCGQPRAVAVASTSPNTHGPLFVNHVVASLPVDHLQPALLEEKRQRGLLCSLDSKRSGSDTTQRPPRSRAELSSLLVNNLLPLDPSTSHALIPIDVPCCTRQALHPAFSVCLLCMTSLRNLRTSTCVPCYMFPGRTHALDLNLQRHLCCKFTA